MYRRPGRGRLLLLIFLVLSIVVITLDFRGGSGGPLEKAKDVTAAVVGPIQRGFTAVFRPIGNFFSSLADLSHLRSDNERLRNELKEATSRINRAEAIEDENARLRQLLGIHEPWFTQEKITAQVTGRVPSNWQWAVTIDKGEADGIARDMAVIAAEGLVGKIVAVGPHTATVLLLIDPQGAASARVQGTYDTGLVEGHGGNEELSLELIGSGTDVSFGSKVVTSSYNHGIFPPDIPIGEITQIGGDEREPTQQLLVRPYVQFTGLDYVQVLLDTGDIAVPDPHAGRKGNGGGD